ncbi:MAG: hypothetical protein RR734_03010 [Bacilli bacterium]
MNKKKTKVIRNYENEDTMSYEYYGILMKNDRARIDTKRYGKFFPISDKKIEHRHSVYYLPSKVHSNDYICNVFRNTVSTFKQIWIDEYSNAINDIKTPAQAKENARFNSIVDGIFDPEEAEVIGLICEIKRNGRYNMIIKSMYAQFFHQFMSEIDASCFRVIGLLGYKKDYFTRKEFDIFIKTKQGKNSISFIQFNNYGVYDEAYCVRNFLKHNSIKAYQVLKNNYPNRIYNPKNTYKNGQSALSVLKIDERYIRNCFDHICDFFDEVCERGLKENISDAAWDYDDYFVQNVKEEINANDCFF